MNKYKNYLNNKILELRELIEKKYNIDKKLKEIFVYERDVIYCSKGIIIKKNKLIKKHEFIRLFEELSREGKCWVHISPIGVIDLNYIVIEYDYSKDSVNIEFPYINWSVGLGKNLIIED